MRSMVAVVLFALVATFFSPVAAQPAAAATSGVDCLCSLTGPYVNATPGVAPAVDASGRSPHGTYTVSANITGGQVNLSVTRTGVTTPILQTSIPANAGWGFSPDDDRFVYHYVTAPTDNVFLYDLAARRQVWTTAVATGSDSIGFSPHGRYLIYSAITAPQHVQLTIADAVAGDAHKYFTEFTVFPGFPIGGATTNTAGWGFSPDSADRTFVYAFASAQTSAQWNVVNLASLTVVHNETITAISSFWQFSPCGDVIGIVTQPFLQQVETRLFGTTTTGGALQGSDQTFAFANVAFRATATSHIANVNGTDHTLAANTAGAACAGTAPAVSLASVAVAPASVVGGSGATGTITLSGPAPPGGFAVALSSNNAAASVAANVSVSQGLTTKSFPITTTTVTAATSATITASGRGVTRTANLTVQPPAGGPPTGPGAIAAVPSATSADACRDNILPRNDDGSTTTIELPFTLNFFGNTFASLYVNNNGNLTFTGPLGTFTPFGLSGARTPIIAPFFGDVDTRNPSSGVVTFSGRTFGFGTFAGHTAFCADWVNVGYFGGHADKLNSFQAILVTRPDTGPDNFDVYFNYDQIQWETGDASGGNGGLGGFPARIGFSNGTNQSFELPGSGVSGAFLDSNTATGLIRNSRNSTQLGRYVFDVRNGVAPTAGTISGTVYRNSATPGNELGAAFVQICGAGGSCNLSTTNAFGGYSVSGLAAGSYTITANGPGTSSLGPASIGPVTLATGATLSGQNLVLTGPTPPPAGTTITNRGTSPDGLPIIYWNETLTLTTTGCVGGTASYQFFVGASVIRSGTMIEGPDGTYTATIGALSPNHGYGRVVITILCGGTPTTIAFDVYIDPSGTVRTTTGAPIAGATVTLFRADTASGPFVQVEDGSGIMSVANRNNPDSTDANGHFGWDVVAGFYRVRAAATDCVSPTNPSLAFVESAVLQIPPAVTDLDLRLSCPRRDTTAPTTTTTANPAPNGNGWNNTDVTVSLTATDEAGGSGVASITYSAAGAQTIASTTVAGATASTALTAEGMITLTYFATDNAGNVETARTQTVRIDKTTPVVTGTRRTAANAAGWNNTPVLVRFDAHDELSGFAGGSHDAFTEVTISTEGDNQSVTSDFADLADNTASATVSDIRIDTHAPATTATQTPAANANGWNSSAVSVSLAAQDNLSGVASISFSASGAQTIASTTVTGATATVPITAEGITTLTFAARDTAGNLETAQTRVIRIDLTAPEAMVRFDPTTLDLAVFARDGGSGPTATTAIAPSALVPATEHRVNRTYRIEDRAGNALEVVIAVKRGHGENDQDDKKSDGKHDNGDRKDGDRKDGDDRSEGNELKASVVSLRYNAQAALAAPKNELAFEWSLSGTALKELEQEIKIGKDQQKQEAEAKFSAKKNETKIEVEDRGGERKLTLTGLVLLRVETDRGALAIRFE